MSKHNFFVKILKKTNSSINSLLKKNLNKLNFLFQRNKIIEFTRSKRVFLFLFIIFILSLSYLSIPLLYNKDKLASIFESQLSKKLGISFIFSKNLNYNLLPRPTFTFNNVSILEKDINLANIDKIKVYPSLKNLFFINDINIEFIFLENANFNLNKENYNFFIKLLNKNFQKLNLEIKNSNIFYRNIENDVLFINKINKIEYYYNSKNSQNILFAKNEIFNIPYSMEIQNDILQKKIISKVNLNLLKLQIEKELDYSNDKKIGKMNFILNKNKSEANYQLNKNSFNFDFFNKSSSNKFIYNGDINFFPFFFNATGNIDKINLYKLLNSQSILIQLFKTKLLNNKNLNIKTTINSKKILPHSGLIDLIANFKIEEGLIDLDNTKFSWASYANFELSQSLLYLNDDNLILDGKIIIDIINYNKIYKFFQTPRNKRVEIKKIEFNFNYNFDHQIVNFNDIKINNQNNQKVSNIINNFIFNKNKLQNKINFKNLMNQAIDGYDG